MEVTKTKKGAPVLLSEGYEYTVRFKGIETWRWCCARRATYNCKGAISTSNTEPYNNPQNSVEHNHPADVTKTLITKAKAELKERAKSTRDSPSVIIADQLLTASDDVRRRIGVPDLMKKMIRRARNGSVPPDPENARDFVIGEDFQYTKEESPKQFLFYQSQKVIIYASENALRVLGNAKTWFMDGNFSLAPKAFSQVYVVRARYGGIGVTCAYAFLTGKTSAIYEEMLRAIRDRCAVLTIQLTMTTIVVDFEQAVISAIRNAFLGKVQVRGCFFHLCQSTRRKVQLLGLTNAVRDSEEMSLYCGMLDGLAFLPENEVVSGMALLWETAPIELFELLLYFDETYVSGKNHYSPALFPTPIWNVNITTVSGGDRTNNIAETWNNSVKSLVGHHHPTFWTAVEGFQKDEAMVTTQILQMEIGQGPNKRVQREYANLQSRLQQLCSEYNAGERMMMPFLRAVGRTIRF